MAGFCPDGRHCSLAHPSPNHPKPEEYVNPIPPDPANAGPPPQLPSGYGRWREYRYDPSAVVIPAPAWVEGGSLSGWRTGGFLSNNARRGEVQGGVGGPGGPGGPGDFGTGDSFSAPAPRKTGWVKDLSTVLCFVSARSFSFLVFSKFLKGKADEA